MDSHGLSPIHYAVLENNLLKVRELLDTPRINISIKDSTGKTALEYAILYGNKEIEKIIHEKLARNNKIIKQHVPKRIYSLNGANRELYSIISEEQMFTSSLMDKYNSSIDTKKKIKPLFKGKISIQNTYPYYYRHQLQLHGCVNDDDIPRNFEKEAVAGSETE